MNIICPHCQFTQDVPADRLPAVAPGKSILATCPRCSCRFRLFPHEGTTQLLESRTAPAATATPPRPDEAADENARAGQPASGEISGRDAPRRQDAEEEEDPRLAASRAYAREAERGRRLRDASRRQDAEDAEERAPAADEKDETQTPLRNPWEEAPDAVGYVEGFYQTVLRVMFGAPRFFAGLRDDAPPLRALLFFLVVGVIGVTALTLWGGVFRDMLAEVPDPQLQSLATRLLPEGSALFYALQQLFLLVLQLYVVSGLIFLALRLGICRSATYARVFQVLAYSSAPMLLCVVPVLGSLAGFIWCLASIVIGCRATFRLSWAQTIAGCLPVILLLALMLQLTLEAMSRF